MLVSELQRLNAMGRTVRPQHLALYVCATPWLRGRSRAARGRSKNTRKVVDVFDRFPRMSQRGLPRRFCPSVHPESALILTLVLPREVQIVWSQVVP